MIAITIEGTIHDEGCIQERTVELMNGSVEVATLAVDVGEAKPIPVEAWGRRRIDFAKASVGKRALFVCQVVGHAAKYVNREGDEAEICSCRLKLKSTVPLYEGD